MSRRTLLLLPAVLAAIAVPVAPALAGEDDPTPAPAPGLAPGDATLHATQGCVTRARAKASVTGDLIASVAFYVDGDLVKTVTEADSSGRYRLTVKCADLSVGAHRAKAVVSFEEGATPSSETMRFLITRSKHRSPRFAG